MILITGACGHIGSVLAKALYAQGYKKLRLFVLPDEDISHVKEYACDVVCGDIRDRQAVSDAVKGCEAVFHLAGVVTVSNRRKQHVMDINYGGTRNVVDACMEHKTGRLVYVSSTDSLKRLQDGRIDETPELNPKMLKSVYARSKAKANAYVKNAAEQGMDAVIVYPSAIIGPYDAQRAMSTDMIRRYLVPGKTQFYFDGKYDFVDVRDAVDGMIKAWRKGEAGQGYILSGRECSIEGMIDAVSESTGTAIRKIRLPAFVVYAAAILAPIISWIADRQPIMSKNAIDVLRAGSKISSDKATKALGYTARLLQSTIDDTVRWIREDEA